MRCSARQLVDAALAAGVDGDERHEVEGWLSGFPDCAGIEIRVRQPLPDANQRLMDFLGVSVVVDESAPPNANFGDVLGKKELRLRDYEGRVA